MEPEGSGGPRLDSALTLGVVCDLGGYFPSLGNSVAPWGRSHGLGATSVRFTCHHPFGDSWVPNTCLQCLPAV